MDPYEEMRQAFERFIRNVIEDKWFLPVLITLWFVTLVGYLLAWAFIPGGC